MYKSQTRFWCKINHFMGNQRSCSSKNLDGSFLCSTYEKIFGNKILKLCFLPGHSFGHTQGKPHSPPPPVPLLGQNFDRWSHARKLCNIYKVACRHTCGQWKPIFISVKVARTYLYSVVVMFLIRVFQNERFNRFLWLFASLINNDRTLRKRYLFSCR